MTAEEDKKKEALPRGQKWLIDPMISGNHKEFFSQSQGGICFGVAHAAIIARLAKPNQSVLEDEKTPVDKVPFQAFIQRLMYIANGAFNGLLQKTQQVQQKMTDAIAYEKLNTFYEMRSRLEKNNIHYQAKFNIDPTKQLPKTIIDAFNHAVQIEIVKLSALCKSDKPLPNQIITQAKKSVLQRMKSHFSPEICNKFLESGIWIDVHYEKQKKLKENKSLDATEAEKVAAALLKEFQDIAQERIEKFRKTLTLAEEQVLQAPAFGDTIALLQSPRKFAHLLADKKSASKDEEKSSNKLNQTDLPALNMIQSVASETAGGMENVTNFTGIYNLRELHGYFTSLQAALKDITEPVVFALSSGDHAIAVIYEPSIKKWRFIDANQLTLADDSHCCDATTIAKRVFAAFSSSKTNKFIPFVTQIYAGNTKQLPAIREAITSWQQSLACKILHKITPKKAARRDSKGISWLYIAAREGHFNVVQRLLIAGANPNQTCTKDGTTPLFMAAQNGHLAAVQRLLAKNANPNQGCTKNGVTPLFMAAQNGHLDVVWILLAKGAKPNQSNNNGTTPLFMAAQNGHLDVVQILLANGANPNQSRTDNGATPLFIAAQNGHLDVVQILLANGANPNQSNNNNSMPLHIAVENAHLEMVQVLLKANADPDPLLKGYEARPNQNKEILKSLEGYSAARAKFKNWVNDLNEDRIKEIDPIPVVPAAFKEKILSQKITLALQGKNFQDIKLALTCLTYFARNGSTTFSTDHLFRDVLHQLLVNKPPDIPMLVTVIKLNPRCVNLKDATGNAALDWAAKAGCSQEVFKVLLPTHAIPSDHKSATKSAADRKKKSTYGRFLNGQQTTISLSIPQSSLPFSSAS